MPRITQAAREGGSVAALADRTLRRISERGELTRTEIVNALGRHEKRVDLIHSRDLLADLGVIRVRQEETDGRPREVWSLR